MEKLTEVENTILAWEGGERDIAVRLHKGCSRAF